MQMILLYIYAPISKSPTTLELYNFQNDLDELCKWCYTNKLSINSTKTKLMILGTNNNKITIPCDIKIDSVRLELVNNYKYLGLLFNSQLTFQEQTHKTLGMVASKINALHYLKRYVNWKILLTIYKTTILPIMEYSNFTYPLIAKNLILKKQRLQNRALKIVFSHEPDLSIEDMHINSKLTSLSQRADKQILLMMYKRSLSPNLYKQLPSDGITRSNLKIRFDNPKPNIEQYKYFPQYYGTKLWDKLDGTVQRSDSYALFKSRLPRTPNFTQYPVVFSR